MYKFNTNNQGKLQKNDVEFLDIYFDCSGEWSDGSKISPPCVEWKNALF